MTQDRSRRDASTLNLCALGILCISTLYFLIIYNSYSLFDAIFSFAFSFESGPPLIIYNFLTTLTTALVLWYITLTAAGALSKNLALSLYGLSFCLPLLIFLMAISMYFAYSLTELQFVSILLSLLSLEEFIGGLSSLSSKHKVDVRRGDWSRVLRGLRFAFTAILLLTPGTYMYFYSINKEVFQSFGPVNSNLDFILRSLPILEAYILTYFVTWIPFSLLFIKCKKCRAVIWRRGVPVSGWDSEHTLRHFHCPRCGAVIDL